MSESNFNQIIFLKGKNKVKLMGKFYFMIF